MIPAIEEIIMMYVRYAHSICWAGVSRLLFKHTQNMYLLTSTLCTHSFSFDLSIHLVN